MGIAKLINGLKEFQENEYLKYKAEFKELVDKGQKPSVLFIGCSDSRVVPNLITKSAPGDLFIVRNIGNFVPPFKEEEGVFGTTAAIEYAVNVLNVDSIIVCGHSHCGAIESLYKDLDRDNLGYVKKWLALGEKAKNIVDLTSGDKPIKEKLPLLEKVSAIFQSENLLTYPYIKERVKKGELKIHIWYYKIETGEIEEYNYENSNFKAIS